MRDLAQRKDLKLGLATYNVKIRKGLAQQQVCMPVLLSLLY